MPVQKSLLRQQIIGLIYCVQLRDRKFSEIATFEQKRYAVDQIAYFALKGEEVPSKKPTQPQGPDLEGRPNFLKQMEAYSEVIEVAQRGDLFIASSGRLYSEMNTKLESTPGGVPLSGETAQRVFRRKVTDVFGKWPGRPGPGFALKDHVLLKNRWVSLQDSSDASELCPDKTRLKRSEGGP